MYRSQQVSVSVSPRLTALAKLIGLAGEEKADDQTKEAEDGTENLNDKNFDKAV